MVANKRSINISEEIDIILAVKEAMEMAKKAGFNETRQHMIGTAVSELARNIKVYATKGQISIRILKRNKNSGIEIIAEDNGPGIKNLGEAMKENFSTTESLGLGLPSVKRLMDEFTIESKVGEGTKIITRKWA